MDILKFKSSSLSLEMQLLHTLVCWYFPPLCSTVESSWCTSYQLVTKPVNNPSSFSLKVQCGVWQVNHGSQPTSLIGYEVPLILQIFRDSLQQEILSLSAFIKELPIKAGEDKQLFLGSFFFLQRVQFVWRLSQVRKSLWGLVFARVDVQNKTLAVLTLLLAVMRETQCEASQSIIRASSTHHLTKDKEDSTRLNLLLFLPLILSMSLTLTFRENVQNILY